MWTRERIAARLVPAKPMSVEDRERLYWIKRRERILEGLRRDGGRGGWGVGAMSHNPQGQRMPRPQRHAQVVALKESGLTFNEIAAQLGLAKSTVTSAYYDATGEGARERRHRADGECVDCGATTHSGGAVPPERCRDCAPLRIDWRKRAARPRGYVFSDETIFEALRSVAVDGNLSTNAYLVAYHRNPSLPSMPTIIARFGKWNEAKRRAGLPTREHPAKHFAWSPEECRDIVLALADELADIPTYTTYCAWRADKPEYPCGSIVRRRLGGWAGVLVICEDHLARDERMAA